MNGNVKMKKVNLQSYSGRQLQTFIALVNQFEQNGLTDIRFVRGQIQNHINTLFVKFQKEQRGERREKVEYLKKCPECKNGILEPMIIDNEHILICKKCRYSKLLEEVNVK